MSIIENVLGKKYDTKHDWKNVFVQFGGSEEEFVKIRFKKEKNLNTPFFEAFPENPKCFIRGEGKTYEEAEDNAYKKYIKIISCKNHEFERSKGYKNGMGTCKHCGLNQIVFEPTTKCICCKKPDFFITVKDDFTICEECSKDSENFYLINDYYLETLLGEFNDYDFRKPYMEEEIMEKLKTPSLVNEDEFFDIIDNSKNIYLGEWCRRKMMNENLDVKGVIQEFFENFVKDFV